MKSMHKHKSIPRLAAAAAVGLAAAGCSVVEKADDLVTARVPISESPYVNRMTADCPEWNQILAKKDFDETKWKFGCANRASLIVSVQRKSDLRRGRYLEPSEAWEAVKVTADDAKGTFDPGKGTSNSSSTENNDTSGEEK